MSSRYAQIAFTPKVQRHQELEGSRRAYGGMAEATLGPDRLGPDELVFISLRDSFYIASVGETGWPYIQHRGGPQGFLRVLDGHRLGFADFRGNRQYITRGNLDHDDRVSLFLMDYANQARLKIFGHARVVDDDPGVIAAVTVDGYPAKVERAVMIKVDAFDWNCRQHIPRLFPAEHALRSLHDRITELERENAELKRARQ